MINHYDYVLIAYEEQAKHGDLSHFKHILKQFESQDRVLMIFGPEGGLSDKEVSLFQEHSTLVGLGPRILRAETAPLYALSAVSFERIIGVKTMSTVAFHTLGCKVNHYETEAIWQLFKEADYDRVDFETNADVFVINTCTVTNTGDKKSRQIIRRAIRQNPEAVVCVTGCYAQTSSAEIMEIPGVDVVVGTQDRHKLLDYIDQFQQERQPINGVGNIMKNRTYEELEVPYFTDRTRASLKIQEGCNNFCTFCIIPWARGLMRSRDPEKVVEQASQLVNSGYKEIVLTGIHTGGYGKI